MESRKDFLSKDDTKAIKGIAALLIFFAHFFDGIVQRGTEVGIGKIWLTAGGIGVSLFFFLSGYGLNKSNSIIKSNFLVKRIKGVLIPFFIIQTVMYMIDLAQGNRASIIPRVVSAFKSTWFVTLILIIYVGYYVCFKLFGRKHLNISVLIFNIVIGILFILLDFNSRWYNAHLLFSLGMYVADYNDRVVKFVTDSKWWAKCGGGILGFLCFSIIFTYFKGNLWSNVFKIFAGICLCFFIFCIMGRCRLNSPILLWIGENSLLVYLIHAQVMNVLFSHAYSSSVLGTDIGLLISSLLMTFGGIAIYNAVGRILCLR
jgi:membrane-bound acyltransferase YfiQ involved in biofilm formation